MTGDRTDTIPPDSWRDSAEVARACARLLAGRRLGRILDAGGGEGFVTAYLMNRHRYAHTVETATVVDESASLLAQVPPPIQTKRGRLEDLGSEDGEFSTILLRQVLHYVESPRIVLDRLRDRLQPSGVIYVGQLVAPERVSAHWLGTVASWVSAHRRRVWTVDRLLAMFLTAGLRLEQAAVVPQWQALHNIAWVRPHQRPDQVDMRQLLRLTEHEGMVYCRVFWLHALLSTQTSG